MICFKLSNWLIVFTSIIYKDKAHFERKIIKKKKNKPVKLVVHQIYPSHII